MESNFPFEKITLAGMWNGTIGEWKQEYPLKSYWKSPR